VGAASDQTKIVLRSQSASYIDSKITILIVAIFLLLTSANSPAESWVLVTPEFKVSDVEILPTRKWVILDSFATNLQCNDRRSSLIRQIDKERRETGGVEDRTAAQTNHELRLLWHIYTSSKCVPSLAR
jgi:hypothetical protein